MENKKILLSHGSGGKLMHSLIEEFFKEKFKNDILDKLADSAVISIPMESEGGYEMCFTTDSYVVDPIFFPGGDIGKLSICGTVNDLAVSGAVPLYISCGFIIEEGFEYENLEKIVFSMSEISKKAGVQIVTGDTKVVEKGKADKLFINTSGVGFKKKSVKLGIEFIKSGDVIIINGSIGEHGLSVLSARENLKFHSNIVSDCNPLNGLILKILEGCPDVKFMRDPTRGGLAATLNEIVSNTDFGIIIDEKNIPVKKEVKAMCEILGFDPMYVANEGKVIIVTGKENSDKIIEFMRKHPFGKDAAIIGEVVKKPEGKVVLETEIGSHRIVDMPVGAQFPRIC